MKTPGLVLGDGAATAFSTGALSTESALPLCIDMSTSFSAKRIVSNTAPA
jgi:hypothetical protein